jgi:energy-converting hydrogenase B subunit D
MSALLALALLLAAVVGTVVVLTREPARQVLVFGGYGVVLTVVFFLLQAPDVALSQLVVGAVALPLMLAVALTRIGRHSR